METSELRVVSALIVCAFVLPHPGHAGNRRNEYGYYIGDLREFGQQIQGQVYAVEKSTIFIKGFTYDGTTPDTYFWAGDTDKPSPQGFIIPYPEEYAGSVPPELSAYNNTDIILRLPQEKEIRNIKWLSVWCRRFTVNFAEVFIPKDLEIPKVRMLPEFLRLAHGLRSGNISILDSKTIYIPNLHYDGAGPDAYFWVGNGSKPNPMGIKVPNEVGSLEPLKGYQGEDIEIVLPRNLTVYDIDWLSVWCVRFQHNFGHVFIPKNLDVPPALGQTKITTSSTPVKYELTNCKELLEGRVEVQWEVIGEDAYIRLSARIRENQYVAFGLSGREGKSQMVGGDVAVVWYNKNANKVMVEDYYMSDLAQCDGKRGVCPDERIGGKNDVVLLDSKRVDGITSATYKRPLRTNELEKDRVIPGMETSVIAAIGPLNSRNEANAHDSFDKTTGDIRIDFLSRNVRSCTNSLYNRPNMTDFKPWSPAKIIGEDVFSARIGATGGKKGYYSITGAPSWGIAWYINDLLIPEVTVERGRTYTFVVEGGDDPANPAKYHPLYITSSPEGGIGQKSPEEQMQQRIFAGISYDAEGYAYPTAAGRYCEWAHKTVDMSDDQDTFASFFETLKLECDEGEPAKLVWTVTEDTPDLVYYQCYTHTNMGWKIHVVDAGYGSRREASNACRTAPRLPAAFAMAILALLLLR